mmetsp:Transcript_73241/g.177065  ORF Transcript_73241/g.177065 Transcript_73241/m.177065 type:complete len:238 (-) Transcript_73241:734-1447(-)
MGTWNSTMMGGRTHAFLRVAAMSSTLPRSTYSAPPGNLRMRHTMAFCSGSYLARPDPTLMCARAVVGGVGTLITTLVAVSLEEKLPIALMLSTTLVSPRSSTTGISRNGRFTLSVMRYRINSNSPSGGTKVMVRSLSKVRRRTQRWKLMSSISTAGAPLRRPPAPPAPPALPPPEPPPPTSRSIKILSLRPNLHSGMPVRNVFMLMTPVTSARSTVPLDDSSRFTLSSTSMNTSFLR